ncbi:DNRLRE domain-containing protein [Streptosporangium canum]|uniref:DNRLRE domain-containing protein n=1 Tax=Streptosporangium canum TaxID=324952 RepID=UPI003416A095
MAAPAIADPTPTPTPTAPAAKATAAPTPVNAAQQEAKKQNKRIEIEALRSESATYFANPDGKTLTTEFYADPIRFKQGDAWQPVDTTLVANNGTIKPRATKAGLTLSSGGGTDLLTAASQRDGSTIKISAPQKLPAPKLSGNRAEYANAYGPGIDLAVIATPMGFRQEVIIRQRPASPPKLTVPVQLPASLAFGETSTGKLALHDNAVKAKRRTTEIPAPLLTDASANLSLGDEGHVGKVTTAVEETAAGQMLIYKPDASFLADPDLTYPLSLVVASTDWMQLSNANDTFINNSAYQNGYANSGAYHLQAGKTNEGTVRWRTYIRFDDITEDSPLRGGQVTNADLILWNIDSNDCGEVVGSGITARRITQRWDMSTLTWSNQPTVTSEGADTENGAYKPGCSRGYMNYEHDLIHYVNPIVQDWADGEPNYGFQLTAGSESDYTNWRAYRSKEYISSGAAHGPKLVIGYTPGAFPSREMILTASDDGLPPDEPLNYEEALAHRLTSEPTTPAIPSATLDDAQRVAEETENSFEVDPDDLIPSEEEEPGTPDLTPPTVVGKIPSADAQNATMADSIQAIFDESVSGVVLTVKGPDGTAVTGDLDMVGGDLAARFRPSEDLQPGTVYTVEVSGAKDAAGNVMAAPHTWSFTTGRATPTPTPTPTDPPGEQHTVTLPVQTDVWLDNKGLVGLSGPDLWAGAYGNTDPKAIERTYLKFDAASLAGKTITDAKLELWNYASYGCGDSGSGIKAQRVTTAWSAGVLTWANQPSATDSGEAVAKDPGGCAGTPPTNVTWTWPVTGMVQAWASGQGNHGVLLRGVNESTSGPQYDRGYQSSRTPALPPHPPVLKVTYTDGTAPTPTSTPTPGPDTTAPTVTTVSPANEAANVPVNAQVKVTFSEPVTDAQVTLTALESEEEVTGSVVMSSGNTVLTFTPSAPLNAIYYGAAVSGAKDAAGNTMAAPYSWSFTATDPTPTPTPTPTPACTYPTWSASKFYSQGDRVTWRGHSWEAVPSWPSGAEPGSSGDWRDLGACSGTLSATSPQDQTEPPSTPTTRDLKPSVGEVWTRPFMKKDNRTVTSTTTPHFMAKVSHPLRRRSTVEFQVEHDPKAPAQGKGLIWSGTAANVSSGTVGTLQVPEGKLADGWKVRWRARAVSEGATGAWSEWQGMSVQKINSGQESERTEQSQRIATAEAAAPRTFPYKHVSWETCWSTKEATEWTRRGDGSKSIGYASNSFNWCAWRYVRLNYYDNKRDRQGNLIEVKYVGNVLARITARAYTHAGNSSKNRNPETDVASGLNSRDIRFTIHADEIKFTNLGGGGPFYDATKLRLGVALGNNKCEVKSGPRDDSFSKEDLVKNWEGKEVEWIIHSPKGRGDGEDRKSACLLVPTIYMTSPLSNEDPGEDFTSSIGFQWPIVRCDTSIALSTYTGGCIFPDTTPTLAYDATKKVKSASVAKHVWDAYYNVQWTAPIDPGKKVPGRHPNGKLHRLLEDNPTIPWAGDPDEMPWGQVDKNRKHSTATCKQRWPQIQPDAQKLDCDEFPFASTHESPLIAGGTNYSVRYINDKENSSGGSDMKNFYMIYRRLNRDPFWVNAKTLSGQENQQPPIWP